jgi:hypothetical protein
MTDSGKSEVRDLAAELATEALGVLAMLMRESASDQVKVAAARELLDRAHGKPKTEAAGGTGPGLVQLIEAANLLEDET